MSTLGEVLKTLTREGELYERLEGQRVRCFACGHRCLIPPGRDGICRVRYNESGTLKVPYGYAAGVQVDPVEKKPFFHALPGARALSFGMLGCDYHCGYCFAPGASVKTSTGSRRIEMLFDSGKTVLETATDAVAVRPGIEVLTHLGRSRPIRGVFRHAYRGALMVIRLKGGAEIRATPDHEFLVSARAARGSPPPSFFVPASAVTPEFDLLEPREEGALKRRPIQDTAIESYEGPVFNLEVEEDKTFLVEGAAVHNCQNWVTSQALRDPKAVVPPSAVSPRDLVALALNHEAEIVTSTYNEPLITSEWAVEVFREAKAAHLLCSYVSNGNATPEVLEYIRPFVSLYKVDLKGFQDRGYRDLGGTLENVLETIRALHKGGFWVEVVTLVVPGFNDSDAELKDIAAFLVSVSKDIPWHVTAFHKDYKMTGRSDTRVKDLLRAAEVGRKQGLHFVYAGNLPGAVGEWEDTRCPSCSLTLVERRGFRVLSNRIHSGACPGCGGSIPGVWKRPA